MPAQHSPVRAFQWDLARQVERHDWLLEQLPRYADWGYQELYLHLEDAVEYPSLPGVARRDAYTYRQMERLVTAATRVGIGVVPIVNLLGHTQYLIKVPALRDLNELRAPNGQPLPAGQICPLHPRTLEIAEKLLRDMAPFCTTGKVHVGLDESFHLGQHPLSRAEIAQIGLPAHFAGYVQRLHALNQSMGLRTGMWADMLYFLPEAIPLLPRNLIAYDWYYYPFKRLPKVEQFNYVARDLAAPLQQQGIEYWGCPMNGAFRYEPLPVFTDRLGNLRSWWNRCQKVKAQGFLVTSWESSRLALETTTVVDAAAASLWLPPEQPDSCAMLTRGLARVFPRLKPRTAITIAQACLQADRYAFTGYTRWEINKRWDLAAGSSKLADYIRERRYFQRLITQSRRQKWPESFAASAEFRHYLAQRDVFVRKARATVFELRRLIARRQQSQARRKLAVAQHGAQAFRVGLKKGLNAAHRMWRRTRAAQPSTPYVPLFRSDRLQLITWQKWLLSCAQQLSNAWQASPVCGRWQLFYDIWNQAPAVQLVAIQQWQQSKWLPLKSCHTIEFQAAGAARRSRLIHQHSVPVEWSDTTKTPPRLRMVLRGAGSVSFGQVCLTNGVTRLSLEKPTRRWQKLGAPAGEQGLPNLGTAFIHEFNWLCPAS
ncbi:MAG: family 20 glycosylhydrolase [Opitutaceae bacterium]|nr:family 20 glycosylhydrolase [Opitutaceae bacterium]MBP9901499.1 family 20 glycosylhydrolase [Verrucomicrobiota bacterium]